MRSCAKSLYKAKCISQKDERMASKGVRVNGGGGEETATELSFLESNFCLIWEASWKYFSKVSCGFQGLTLGYLNSEHFSSYFYGVLLFFLRAVLTISSYIYYYFREQTITMLFLEYFWSHHIAGDYIFFGNDLNSLEFIYLFTLKTYYSALITW